MSAFEHINVEIKGAVGLIRLYRSTARTCSTRCRWASLVRSRLVDELEANAAVGCIVVTGSEKAFAAGADIKEMRPKTFVDMFLSDLTSIGGDRLAKCRKPTIAAVAGYALGGGLRACDDVRHHHRRRYRQIRPAGNHARHHPGIGGTQRLTRAVGKSKAMDLCLTGRTMDAAAAERSGLVSRVVPADRLMDEVLAAAEKSRRCRRPKRPSTAPLRRRSPTG